MLFRSTGLICGTFCSNDWILTRGTIMTVPEISAGLSRPINLSSAMIEAYSVPCAPETSASTGPGFAPWKTATGMLSPASLPAGIATGRHLDHAGRLLAACGGGGADGKGGSLLG